MSATTEKAFLPMSWEGLPIGVGATFTTRLGGNSLPPFNSFNIGCHVGDDPGTVDLNREFLKHAIGVDNVHWLKQVHGNENSQVRGEFEGEIQVDASWTTQRGLALVIQVADCLPVLIADKSGNRIGAAHAGWRGLCSGVIPRLLEDMNLAPKDALVWLGPCIGPRAFEVGPEVFSSFVSSPFFRSADVDASFFPGSGDRLYADLQKLARNQLEQLGCESVSVEKHCTYSEPDLFYSYRRDGVTGRHAALIWINTN
tara:strand:+ start:37 stop:804 length:768 start_codon:yes stop_codon:yes gene_type:complete